METYKEKIIEIIADSSILFLLLLILGFGVYELYQLCKAQRKPRKGNIISAAIMIALQSIVVLLEFLGSSINIETLAYATIIIAVCLCFLVPESIFYYRMRKQEKRKKEE
ncbi:MAG: hypothetical protein E7584_06520 [Ruminococcaceae bacterium]|nr:hypothetical protein [Oscillospiraceae bacterium]